MQMYLTYDERESSTPEPHMYSWGWSWTDTASNIIHSNTWCIRMCFSMVYMGDKLIIKQQRVFDGWIVFFHVFFLFVSV